MEKFQYLTLFLIFSGLIVFALTVWIFWPRVGLLALISKTLKANKKILFEDTLKMLYNRKYKSIQSDISNIAGNLNITTNKASRVLEKLEKLGLVNIIGRQIQLTETGIAGALKIIRAHRILEKYFAEKTGYTPTEWHTLADMQEHRISNEIIGEISQSLGNPVYDPHGDPIPTADGKLPVQKGQPLSTVNTQGVFIIVRVEDKPVYIYEQISALGIYPGSRLLVLHTKGKKITLIVNGNELVLTTLFASSIIVEKAKTLKKDKQEYDVLSSLKIGEKAEITKISGSCHGQQRRRLMDLGVVPGSIVTAEIRSALGDPVGYRIMGAIIGIRKKQASLIYINKTTVNNENKK